MVDHVHIGEDDPITEDVEFCRVCNPNPQYLVSGGLSLGLGSPKVIGPFRVSFDDAAMYATGVLIQVLPAGTLVLDVWVNLITVFNSVGDTWLDTWVGTVASGATIREVNAQTATFSADWSGSAGAADFWPHSPHFSLNAAGGVGVFAVQSGGDATTGEADIYALIAEPV